MPLSNTCLIVFIQFLSLLLVWVQILGNLLAPEKDAWGASCGNPWLHFLGVGGLTIDGSGVINGHGHAWWGNVMKQIFTCYALFSSNMNTYYLYHRHT